MKVKASFYSNVVAVVANLALAYVVYMVTRVAFVLENIGLFAPGWDKLSMWELLCGSLRFDTSAIFYTNALWIVLMLLPVHLKERRWWHTLCRWLFVVVNALGASLNLVDAVYSQYTGRRTTATFFSEFKNEGNLGGILFTELLNHWYLLLLGIALIFILWRCYVNVEETEGVKGSGRSNARYYVCNSLALLVAIPMAIFAMRGGFTRETRPITISNAHQYVHSPAQASIVLNTPFSLIRTAGKKPFKNPHFFSDDELDTLYTPLHQPADTVPLLTGQRNVVVLIMESFSREYIGYYNTDKEGGRPSYTPFLDSLLAHSLTWTQTYANGRKSIDAMPSILSSIPMFVEPFFLTTASLNDVGGIAQVLASDRGYHTAFFHGAANGSMGFQAFARATGFKEYYGRTEYDADPAFGGKADFDGTWAIWDEPFLQFFAASMSRMPQPFMTALFSASSHHPFAIPQQYEGRFPKGPQPIHQCIGYSDNALRLFFKAASKQPWFKNTLFVITADHTNQLVYEESKTSVGVFSVPIAFYDPSGQLPTGRVDGVAQQNDIMPTLLRILGYDKPFVAFGKNLLDDSQGHWAVNYSNGIYQYLDGTHVLLFDGERSTALYDYVADPLLQRNSLAADPQRAARMETALKAIIQSYMDRMTTNRLIPH